jgi:molybdate transport system permease protein
MALCLMLAETSPATAALLLSLKVGACATLVALLPAMALSYWLARTASRLRPFVEALVILPMVLPPVVVGYFLLVLFGRGGVLGLGLAFTWQGAALAALVMGLPLMVRTMRQAFEDIDQGLEDAAAVLGAGKLHVFFSVTAPMALRGLVAGALLCFARSLGEFGATITFAGNVEGAGRTLPVAIWTAMQTAGGDASAWFMTWICVAVAVAATLVTELLVRQRRHARSPSAETSA